MSDKNRVGLHSTQPGLKNSSLAASPRLVFCGIWVVPTPLAFIVSLDWS